MKNFKHIMVIMAAIMISIPSCTTNKPLEHCEIKKVSSMIVINDDLYSMKIKFSDRASKETREKLVKEELKSSFPSTQNKTITIREHLGKKYNEYLYTIKVE